MFELQGGGLIARPLLQLDAYKLTFIAKIDVRSAAALECVTVRHNMVNVA